MSHEKRATVMIVQRGDGRIAGAITEGILTARAEMAGRSEPAALPVDQIEIVEAEIDRQHIMRALVRVAVGNHKTAEDYRYMTTRAAGLYGERRRGPLRRLGDRLLIGWAMLCYGIAEIYGAQRHVLGGRRTE